MGNLVGSGMVGSTATGGATVDATYNTINSSNYVNPDEGISTHVFDWATTSGNGTFRSIWWTGTNAYGYQTSVTQFSSAYPYTTLYGTAILIYGSFPPGTAMAIDGLYIYYLHNLGTVDRVKLGYPATIPPVSFSLGSISTLQSLIDYDGTYFYTYARDGLSPSFLHNIRKYDSNFNLLSTQSLIFTGSGTAPVASSFCKIGVYTYLIVNGLLYKYDASGNILVTNTYVQYGSTTAYNPSVLSTDGVNLLLMVAAGYSFLVDTVNCLPIRAFGLISSSLLGPFHSFFRGGKLAGKGVFLGSTGGANNYICSLPAPFTQTLLASPVTKTTSNTMKITYTFNWDFTNW